MFGNVESRERKQFEESKLGLHFSLFEKKKKIQRREKRPFIRHWISSLNLKRKYKENMYFYFKIYVYL